MWVNKLFTVWGSRGDYTYHLLAVPQQVKAEAASPSFLRLHFLKLMLETGTKLLVLFTVT